MLGIQEIGVMMGMNSVDLERALCSRTVETAKEKVVTQLNVSQVRTLPEEPTLRLSCGCCINDTVPHPRLSMLGTPWLRMFTAVSLTG